jgi:hypothetical protein
LSSGEEFPGSIPFLFAEAFESSRPIGGLFAEEFSMVLGLLLEKSGLERVKALNPIEPRGPIFEGGKALTDFIGDGLERARLAKIEPRHEGGVSAGSLAGRAIECWFRVEG